MPRITRHLPLVLAALAATLPASATDWPQFGYDATHSGSNTSETTITTSNVTSLVSLYATPVTLAAAVDSAPVYKANVSVGGTPKNLLFFLSNSGRVMAIDAATGTSVWSHTTTGPQPATASPAIDPDGQFVYSYGVDGFAHKYKIDDGTETTTGGWPQRITLKTGVEKGASGLTIATSGGTNYLVVVTDGYIGDGGNYQGHLVSINLADGTQKVFNTLCSNRTIHLADGGTDDCSSVQNGIWGRGGATFDAATGHVYIATGNGPYNANTGGFNWGDSVLALNVDGTGSGGGMPVDSYTPTEFQQLENQDADLGSTSMAVLPVPAGSTVAHLGMEVGKDHQLRLINLDNMSGQGAPAHVGGEVQKLAVPQGGNGMREQPAVWVNPADSSTWLFVGNGQGISGLQLGLNASNVPQLTSRWSKTSSSTSAIVANGVLYNAGACTGGKCVIARNPLTGDVLWTSPVIGSLHWQSPILVDGALYMTDNSAKLWKFGLSGVPNHTVTPTAGSHGSIAPSTPQSVADGSTTSFSIAPDAHYAIAGVSGCSGTLSATTYTTGAITADCTVTASFVAITHVVTPTVTGGGTIDPATAQTVIDGDTSSFTITPASGGISFDATGCDGTLAGSVYTTGPVSSDCTVVVIFSADDWIFRDGFETLVP